MTNMTGLPFRSTAVVLVRTAFFLLLFAFWGTRLPAASQETAKDDLWYFPGPSQPNTNLTLMTEIHRIRELTGEEAKREYPFRLRAVVTYFDPRLRTLFVQDETAGIWVVRSFQETNFYAGDLLELTGATWSISIYGPAIRPGSIRVLGRAPLPTAKPVTYETLASGRIEGQRSRAEGVVRRMAYEFG